VKLQAVHTIPGLKRAAGGVSRSVPGLCTALSRAGLPTLLVSQRDRNTPRQSPLLPDADVVPTRLIEGYDWERLRVSFTPGLARELEGICRDAAPCVVHDHGLWLHMNHVTARVAARTGVRRVVSPRGMLDGWSLQYRGWKKNLAWSMYQRRDLELASAFSATSLREADSIRALGLRQPVAVIPNGIDMPGQSPRAQPEPDQDRMVLFMSRIHPKKGLLDLVAAWARLQPAGWRLVIAGPDEGGHQAEVQAAARAAGIAEAIDFVGPLDGEAKERALRGADIFVLPTYSENFGIVVGEALSYGVPVITTNVTPWEELTARDCGWWIDTGADPLAGALAVACSASDERRREMGKRGRRLIEERYSWRSAAEKHIEFYQWLWTGADKPSCMLD
jgi:glycosyltransferase involved in cell wall biosynthesis